MVLVNAFYFKGLWNKEFKKSNTIKTSFWISSKESVKVPMMRSSGYFSHGSCGDIGASVLSMNYKVCIVLYIYCKDSRRVTLQRHISSAIVVNIFIQVSLSLNR